jgi:hypothetical protein
MLILQHKTPALHKEPVLSKIEGSKEAPLNILLSSLCSYALMLRPSAGQIPLPVT